MQRVRKHCADLQVNRLLVQFLKAGVLSEEQFLRTDAGTPQGGIISPLLANIALGLSKSDTSGGWSTGPSGGHTGRATG